MHSKQGPLLKFTNSSQGFSLIELMVTVAIIGVLVGMAIPNYSLVMRRTRVKLTISQLINFSKTISGIRFVEQKAVMEITGSNCTRCSFASVGDHASTWTPDATAIARYRSIGFEGVPKDVWDSYYLLNEEEVQYPCYEDLLRSAGANKVFESNATGSDDIWINIPKYYNPSACPVDGILVGDSVYN